MDREKLVETIKDVLELSDEIVVIDTSPTPINADLGKKVKVYHAKHLGYPDIYRTWAFQKCSGDWIFLIDTDERLTQGFKANLLKTIKEAEADGFSGIMIKRREQVDLDKDWSKTPESTIMRIFKEVDASSTGNLHDIIRIDGKILDATGLLVLLHLKRNKLCEKYRIQYEEVDILRRLSYKTLLKRFRLPPVFRYYIARKEVIDGELSDVDYFFWYLMLNMKLSLIERGNLVRNIWHTATDLKNVKGYKKRHSEELFYAIDEANDVGLTKYLGLNMERNIRVLTHKNVDGINLLLTLILKEYRNRHQNSRYMQKGENQR